MEIIFFVIYTIIILCIGMEVSWNLWYSPKAIIRRTLKQMYNLPIKFKRAERQSGDKEDFYYNGCKDVLKSRYRLINELLNVSCYFDQEKDKEYIEKTKHSAQIWLNSLEEIFKKKLIK